MDNQIAPLKQAIHRLHGCDSTHVESVRVMETFAGEIVWEGDVEVFDLIDHQEAERAYAWVHETDGGKFLHVAVLHKPPVDSPRAAVQALIAAESGGVSDNTGLLEEPSYLFSRLEMLDNVDIFLGNNWVLEREDLLAVYPYHVHLQN